MSAGSRNSAATIRPPAARKSASSRWASAGSPASPTQPCNGRTTRASPGRQAAPATALALAGAFRHAQAAGLEGGAGSVGPGWLRGLGLADFAVRAFLALGHGGFLCGAEYPCARCYAHCRRKTHHFVILREFENI